MFTLEDNRLIRSPKICGTKCEDLRFWKFSSSDSLRDKATEPTLFRSFVIERSKPTIYFVPYIMSTGHVFKFGIGSFKLNFFFFFFYMMSAITWAPLMREVLGIISMRWLFKCTFYAYVQLVILTGTVGLIYHLGALSKDYGPLISHTGPTRPITFQRWASAYCQKTEKN